MNWNSKHIYLIILKKYIFKIQLNIVKLNLYKKYKGMEVFLMKKKSSARNPQNVIEALDKTKNFFSNPKVRLGILSVFFLVVAYLTQYFVNKPDFGAFLSSDMDSVGNVYVLGVNQNKSQYKVTKIRSGGSMAFKVDLENSNDEAAYSYRNIEADSKGNFYLVKEKRNLKAVASDKSLYPISSESVLMYDTNGNYIKEVVNLDFSKYANPPVNGYIQKIQILNQKMTVVGCQDDRYDVITANPLTDESPKKIKTFTVTPPVNIADRSIKWVGDVSVLSTGRVFYSTKNGQLWGMNNQGEFTDYSNAISTSKFLITEMSVDSNDDIYFNDSISGSFYKLDTKSITSKVVYNLDTPLDSSQSILVRDVRKIKLIDNNDFYAPSKAFDKPFYVRFGSRTQLITDVRGSFFPKGFLIIAAVFAILWLGFYAVKFISKADIKRVPLAIRIIAMFLPVYLVSMGILVFVNTSDSVSEYMSILKSEQERGAKTVADSIDASEFSKLDHVGGYMNVDYLKIKKSVENGYNDLSLKIGDRSDYLVTYIERYNKLYATINTRYNVSSSSYDKLKYTNPDMVSSHCALIDSVMERDECEALYDIWNQFSDKKNSTDSLEATFRDVYGNMTGSFVALKDSNGRIVGFVGNFLDSSIHTSTEFWRIFKHSLAVILVIAVFIFAYMCFSVKWSLRPLKKIENAINTMGKGQWNTRIQVKSKDELADIAQAFNVMSEKIERYTSNLIRLNKEYVRYVPTEIFRFMNKEKITQVKLHDHNIVHMNIIYVTFNLSYKGSYDFKDENEIFEALNKTYSEMFKVVENNNGVVQSFDGLDAVILFPDGAKDAFNASIQFKEIDISKSVKEHINITLGAGDVLIGVSGNEDRRGVVVVSDEIMQMFNIDTQIGVVGINHAATRAIVESLEKDEPYDYRFIGRVGNITGEGYTEIFEVIDSSNKYRKDLYMSTKELFEKGIEKYLLHEFEQARRMFTDVLRVNENDKVAIHYLMKCEEQMRDQENDKFLKKGFTGYIV